ncbi:MAG: hypothetical protein FJX72_12840 [Armatimonadetes bacterium]|nr:hypothetical protein [Armatimonadota bacterium]
MASPLGNDEPSRFRLAEARRALDRKWVLTPLNGKVPVLKGWQSSKPASFAEVQGWVAKGHNLGLRTGSVSGVIVIDDDSTDGSASATLGLPKTVTVVTGSGKRHYYFKAPNFKVGNSVKSLADGIDVRGDGGQVVFVGSLHPDTHRPYAWAPGLSPDEVALAKLPAPLLEKLAGSATGKIRPSLQLVEHKPTHGPDGDTTKTCRDRVTAYVEAALDAEAEAVASSAEGARNDTLNKAAFALGQFIGAGVLDRERARAVLLGAAAQSGLPDAEAERTIASGLAAGMPRPREISSLHPHTPAAASGPRKDQDPRPTIRLLGGWLHRITSQAEQIVLCQQPPLLYQRGTTLVRVVQLPEGGTRGSLRKRPMIKEITVHAMIDHLTRLIRWEKYDRRKEEFYPVDCTERVAQTLLSRSGDWALPALIGVIDAPTLRSDGGVLDAPGHDKQSGIYVALSESFPAVPVSPPRDDALAAMALLRRVIKDFHWLEPVDESVALATILTALIRPSLRTAPLFAFRAAKMGSGKSLLADVVALIATGRPAAAMSQGADENEDKKRMLPILAEGDPVAVIDNVERPFGSAALCSILTQSIWRDRVLGKSQTASLPTTNTTWIVTGNNIVFVGDITTRVVVCDLDPRCERPEERKFDVNLHKHVPEHRGELVVAGLTVLRAFHVAGRPDMGLPVFGRFEEWSDWVRSALVWLGMPDPCATRRRIEDTDPVRLQIAALLVALQGVFSASTFTVAQVLASDDKILRESVATILTTGSSSQSPAQSLGIFFQHVQRRPEGSLRLVRDGNRSGSGLWRVEHV